MSCSIVWLGNGRNAWNDSKSTIKVIQPLMLTQLLLLHQVFAQLHKHTNLVLNVLAFDWKLQTFLPSLVTRWECKLCWCLDGTLNLGHYHKQGAKSLYVISKNLCPPLKCQSWFFCHWSIATRSQEKVCTSMFAFYVWYGFCIYIILDFDQCCLPL